MEAAHLGPGATDVSKPFGSDIKNKMHMGNGRLEFPVQNNPPPGQYNTDAGMAIVKPKSYQAFIKPEDPNKKEKEKKLKESGCTVQLVRADRVPAGSDGAVGRVRSAGP